MSEMKLKSISNVSFADSSIISFSFEINKDILTLFINGWDEKIIKVSFSDVLHFEYNQGSFLDDIYEVCQDSDVLRRALKTEYEKIPDTHPYKLIEIKDIDDDVVLKVVCAKCSILKEGIAV